MCDPLTISGIAAGIGSAALNSMAQSKVQRARDDALAAERIRQTGLDREAQALNVQSQDRYQDVAGQQDQRSDKLGDYFTDQQITQGTANVQATQDMANSVLPTSGSNITVSNEARKRGEAQAFTDAQGRALGELRAFGDLLGEIGRGQSRDASLIGQIGGFKRGSSGVLPYELDQASSAGDSLKSFGDLLALGGSVATSAGVNGVRIPGFTSEAFAGYADPNVRVSGTGVVPAKGPVSYFNIYGSR